MVAFISAFIIFFTFKRLYTQKGNDSCQVLVLLKHPLNQQYAFKSASKPLMILQLGLQIKVNCINIFLA